MSPTEPSEIASVALFLASDLSSFITERVLEVTAADTCSCSTTTS
jgi:NAD(P)-dependent dehydrogenase (short-subunit alcohol dehydrogenase family)